MNHEKIVVELELDDILPNRFQRRFRFPEQAITELAESIKEHGVIQPILVRRLGDKYEIIAGERRYKASLLAGKRTIPAIVAELNDKDSAEVALIENVQRQDLTPIEEAVSYRKILDMGYLTQEQLADKLGKTQSTVSNKLRLLNLDDDVQEALLDEKISERHARSLLKIDSKQQQREILEKIIKERLTVKKTDELINKILKGEENISNTIQATEIPSIFMNNSVQVEEPAIQSSSAIEFINSNDQVVNSFGNTNTKDEDLLDFLNIDSTAPQTVPVEEPDESIIYNPVQQADFTTANNMNDNYNIPTSPIIEEIEPQPISSSSVSSSESEIDEINNKINNISNGINPGFVDVDNIEKNAKDIYVERPLADIDNLLMSENNEHEQQNTNVVNSFNEQPVEQPVQQNKFFTMFAPEENEVKNEEITDTNDEEVFNFTPSIESNNSLNQFLTEEEPVTTENNINNVESTVTPEFSFNNIDAINNNINEKPEILNSTPEVTTEEIFESAPITELNYSNEDSIEEIDDEPKIINYPADNILAESVRKEDVLETKQEQTSDESVVDLKTVINTIRNCADTIEKYGFALECEEYDFEDMYQVIFKIQKNDKY